MLRAEQRALVLSTARKSTLLRGDRSLPVPNGEIVIFMQKLITERVAMILLREIGINDPGGRLVSEAKQIDEIGIATIT